MPDVKIVVQTPVLTTTQVVGGVGNIIVDDGSSSGIQHNQESASASWNIIHNLGRVPNVQVYVDDQAVIVDIEATATNVNIVFAQPQIGIAVLT